MCTKIHANKGQMPPCEKCLPALEEENRDAVMIWSLVADQVIIAPMGGAVALSHEAIHRAMELFEIPKRRACFTKVLRLAHEFIGAEDDA